MTTLTMKNRELFHIDPNEYLLANQGVAKISFPPTPEAKETLRSELSMFVCDGEYAHGLSRILEAYLTSLSRGSNSPAVWISGFYGSGKSHLASMLAALWTNLTFEDGATAEGLVPSLPKDVAAPLKELRSAANRHGGIIAAGDTLGTGPSDPAEATLSIILRAVGLPTNIRAAQVALWLAEEGILDSVRAALGDNFDRDIRNFILSPRFSKAVLEAKPGLANDTKDLSGKLKAQFPEPPPVTVDFLEDMGRQVLMLGRNEIPLTLIVLDEVQEFVRQDPSLTLKIQMIAERLSSRFDGRVLLVATGQQALSDLPNLQKLLDRFPVQIGLGEADVDTVIRKTVLRKKPDANAAIQDMLSRCNGEISRHLRGSKLAHTVQDNDVAVLDWPLLPSRRRLWEIILRELDRTGLGGTLRGQLRTTLDAAKSFADQPLGYTVPADFLYGRFATDAFNAGLLPSETRNQIESLKSGSGNDPLKARILMIIYMLGRISGDAEHHGVRTTPEIIADLLTVDLSGEADLRRRVPELLKELNESGAVIEISGEWKLQTKESADWENTYRTEEKAVLNDQASLSRTRRELLDKTVENYLSTVSKVLHGISKTPRNVNRLKPGDKEPTEGITVRIHNGWEEDLNQVEKEISAVSTTDPTVHLLIPILNADALSRALATKRAAENVLQLKGVPSTDAGHEAKKAMFTRADKAGKEAEEIIHAAVNQAKVIQAGGQLISGPVADAVKEAAQNALIRMYPKFDDADHNGWDKVFDRAQKKDMDALKAVEHTGAVEDHPVCKAILNTLGSGRKGGDLRDSFTSAPYGWPKDAVGAALMVLVNAGVVKVIGEDKKPLQLADTPNAKAKIGVCTFTSETTRVSAGQRLAVEALLSEAKVDFVKNQAVLSVIALLDQMERLAKTSGGEAPAPASELVPDLDTLRGLSGNDLLVALADRAPELRKKLKAWVESAKNIQARMPNYQLAKRLSTLGATEQAKMLNQVHDQRLLLSNPDPVPPIIADAAESLRSKLNAAYNAYTVAWEAADRRLSSDENWKKLSSEQADTFRCESMLIPVKKPALDTPMAIADELTRRGLSEWDNMAKALPARVDEALIKAAKCFEPKIQTVQLPSGTIKDPADLQRWLDVIRRQIEEALTAGPVVPRV